ncbi:hypothetical protein OPKNFCMD_1110 [Methylobacterium crusticola]|uniref:DUF3617 family protein n=1 Tax=Methylobacterium crusticola TaxID=1697972 RepID=A0ABQ4QT73_9HYPH|nr:DUF3617 family protein [Methylobacterium crusticola]GJD48392.1 hypothetical protein OPKNFCMD_1110 [Methylobacterium crusticola]
MGIGRGIAAAGLIAAGAAAAPARAGEPVSLRPGAYEVEVRLALPHVEDAAPRKVTRICLDGSDPGGARGLSVLGDNNPLARCPATPPHREGEALTFAIVCAGRNEAQGSAAYVLAPEAFRGRIAMRLGGKNMTMTEVQAGHRVGACEAGPGAAPGP